MMAMIMGGAVDMGSRGVGINMLSLGLGMGMDMGVSVSVSMSMMGDMDMGMGEDMEGTNDVKGALGLDESVS